ncbi:flavin-containing monooxygenase [Geomicrobium sediminis]|uniref:Flavoprotein involved in K+ transport n=1 Tax=Geomicrobium sediminis TaxID=1347788 RepID=A0ABS2PGK8_9BACL|nr:NAD(P)/FAD-dependent oxidoreductase [Geomicrobium sediminis]MBM7634412.1 putative flavoprotein involved in K+ transport [Geomicrobium sediminis]
MLYDVIIVGGGQAGLAMGYSLKRKNKCFIILDENETTGESWRRRYDSLQLFTPRNYSQLHGFLFNGDPAGFPHKNEVVDYLKRFKEENDLPVIYNQKVKELSQENDQKFLVITQNQRYTAKHIVVATGAFHHPFIQNIHDNSIPYMIHASDYKNSLQIPEGEVLIVGAGNTGIQIAAELSRTHSVLLAKSKQIKRLPQSIAGKSLFWWFEFLSLSNAKPDSILGKFLQKRDPIIGDDYKIVKKYVGIYGRVKGVNDGQVHFEGQSSPKKISSIIWATGYRNDYSWINIDGVINKYGKPIHRYGITNIKGLYFIGLSWQSKRSSALIYGVSDDANRIAKNIV